RAHAQSEVRRRLRRVHEASSVLALKTGLGSRKTPVVKGHRQFRAPVARRNPLQVGGAELCERVGRELFEEHTSAVLVLGGECVLWRLVAPNKRVDLDVDVVE